MRNITVYPSSAKGVMAAPSSMEEALPAIVLAAITKTSVRGAGSSADTVSIFNGLFALGAKFRQQEDVVTFYKEPQLGDAKIECTHNVLMLLLPLCIVLGGEYTFLGEFDRSIIQRLESLDIDWSVSEQGVTIRTIPRGKDIVIEENDFLNGFLLSLPMMDGAKIIYNGKGKSTELVLEMMRGFGFSIDDSDGGFEIVKHREVNTNFIYSVGGDYGRAAYLLLAGFLAGEVGVTGLLADSMQSKRKVIEQLKELKLDIQEMNGAVFAKKSRIEVESIDISKMAEPIVVLVLACFCKGKCVIKNVDQLSRGSAKEFDTIAKVLQKMGADIIRIGQEYFITGKRKLFGGNVDVHNNQNMAMAMAAVGLVSEIGVTLSKAPSLEAFHSLGVTIQ
jgi:5-enolpyruvylshikimate-3-phosphate synthase